MTATRSNRARALVLVFGVVAALGSSAAVDAKEEEKGAMIALDPKTLKFAPIPEMPACATGAILRGNPRWGAAWVLLKLDSGCRVPWHWHSANEDLVIVSGQGTLEMKDGPPLKFVPGAYASMPNHHVHRASCTRSCLLFSIADGAFDIHYVDAGGEEISWKKALQVPAKAKRGKK